MTTKKIHRMTLIGLTDQEEKAYEFLKLLFLFLLVLTIGLGTCHYLYHILDLQ
jgi:hypothetical protein